MNKDEILTRIEDKLGTPLQNFIPLSRLDRVIDKIQREKNPDFDINDYLKNIVIKNYDFRRPDKFSKDQLRTISLIHEHFARLTTTGLSAALRTECSIRVSYVDQMTLEEFLKNIPNPTVLSIIDMNPLKGNAILEIDPILSFAMVEKLFGGAIGDNSAIKREISEIECVVLEGIIIRMLGNLSESWSNIIDLKPVLDRIEVNPQFTQIVSPYDMVILISLETSINDLKGSINICLPYITIEPLIKKLTGQYWYSAPLKKSDSHTIKSKIGKIKLPVKIGIPAEPVSIKRLYNIKKGDLIKIPEFKKGEFILFSGQIPVSKLLKKTVQKKSIDFELIETDTYQDWHKPVKENINRENNLKILLREPLDKLTQNFTEIINKIDKKIDTLTGKQDELFDEISFTADTSRSGAAPIQLMPFEILDQYQIDDIVNLIQYEHPQTIAMILSHLKPNLSSSILSLLGDHIQFDVIQRIISISYVNPDFIKEIETVFKRKLTAHKNTDYQNTSGIKTVVEILNLSSPAVERSIIEQLEKQNPELAEEIKKRMFVFEDIVLLDNPSLKKILEVADEKDLILSLKQTHHEVKNRIYSNMKKPEINEIEKKLSEIGPVKLTKVEEAKQKIVNIIRMLETQGEITISRMDEEMI